MCAHYHGLPGDVTRRVYRDSNVVYPETVFAANWRRHGGDRGSAQVDVLFVCASLCKYDWFYKSRCMCRCCVGVCVFIVVY
jgi:hypothetical protein